MRHALYHITKPVFQSRGWYRALEYVRRAAADDPLYWGGAVDLAPDYLSLLFTRRWAEYTNVPRRYAQELTDAAAHIFPSPTLLQQMVWYEFEHRLPELLLMRVDKLTMAHSVEARVPFLDYRLVEFTMNLPGHVRLPDERRPNFSSSGRQSTCCPEKLCGVPSKALLHRWMNGCVRSGVIVQSTSSWSPRLCVMAF